MWCYENHEYKHYKPDYPQIYNIKSGKRYVGNDWYMGFKNGYGVKDICLLMIFYISLIFCFRDSPTYTN